MATSTVPQTYDKSPSSMDWREGLVVLPADHVYGATALTSQEWRQMAHRRKEMFVTLVSTPFGDRAASKPGDYATELGHFRYGVGVEPPLYTPHTGWHLSMLAEVEWHRIQREVTS